MQTRSRFQNLLLLKNDSPRNIKHKENSHACLPKLSYRALKTIPLLRTSLQNLPQPWLPSHPPLISVSELLASQIKWGKKQNMLAQVESKGCRSWLQGECKGPCGVALRGQMLAGWGSGGRSAGRLVQGGGRRVGYKEKRQKGNSCSWTEKWWKMWLLDLAHAAPCQNSRVLPSSVQIFQEIMVQEPRGKGWSKEEGQT